MISIKQLQNVYRESTIKNNSSEGFFNVFIFRRISIVFSFALASLRIHPNLISLLAFFLTNFGGFLLLVDFRENVIIGIVLISLGYILDMSDGEVARLNGKKSKFGAFLDPFLDRFTDISLPLFVGLGYVQISDSKIVLLFLIIIFVATRASIYYLDQVSAELNVEIGMNTIRKSTSLMPDVVNKYVKWDGGFSVALYSIAIFTNQIIFLFLFLLAFYSLLLVISLKKVINAL